MSEKLTGNCSDWHDPFPEMGYMAAVFDSEIRLDRGERCVDSVCPKCGKFGWSVFYHHIPVEILNHVGGKHWVYVRTDRKTNPDYNPSAQKTDTKCGCLNCLTTQ